MGERSDLGAGAARLVLWLGFLVDHGHLDFLFRRICRRGPPTVPAGRTAMVQVFTLYAGGVPFTVRAIVGFFMITRGNSDVAALDAAPRLVHTLLLVFDRVYFCNGYDRRRPVIPPVRICLVVVRTVRLTATTARHANRAGAATNI